MKKLIPKNNYFDFLMSLYIVIINSRWVLSHLKYSVIVFLCYSVMYMLAVFTYDCLVFPEAKTNFYLVSHLDNCRLRKWKKVT